MFKWYVKKIKRFPGRFILFTVFSPSSFCSPLHFQIPLSISLSFSPNLFRHPQFNILTALLHHDHYLYCFSSFFFLFPFTCSLHHFSFNFFNIMIVISFTCTHLSFHRSLYFLFYMIIFTSVFPLLISPSLPSILNILSTTLHLERQNEVKD